MSVPKTLGKMCTNLAEMEIGDYIPCVYESTYLRDVYVNYFKSDSRDKNANKKTSSYEIKSQEPVKNIVGYFSQLGIKNPVLKVITHTTIDGVKQADSISEKQYSEIDSFLESLFRYGEKGFNPTHGIFYLIKIDRGKLIADRNLMYTDFMELNSANYINGGLYQVTKARTKKVIDIVITNKTYESTDTAKNEIVYDDSEFRTKRIEKFVQTKVEVGNSSTPTKTTVTTVTIYFAEYDDNPKPTIISVVNPNDLTINNSENNLESLKSKLEENVSIVEVNILGIDGETTSTKSMNVTWDIPTFDTSLDEQIIYGDLEDKENDDEDPISNPDGIRAKIKIVNDGTEEISKYTITPPPDLKLSGLITSEDKIRSAMKTNYQQVTVNILNDNGNTTSKNVNVEWDLSTFDYENFTNIYQQTIYGKFTDSEFSNIGLKPSFKTIAITFFTKLSKNKKSLIPTCIFKFGVSKENVINYLNTNYNAPKRYFETCYSYGGSSTTASVKIETTWNNINFEENKAKVQQVKSDAFAEIIDYNSTSLKSDALSSYHLTNFDDLRVICDVVVPFKGTVDSFNEISISVSLGTSISEISSKLGNTIIGNTTEDCYDPNNNKTSEIFDVEWDLTSININEVGSTTIQGTITSEDKDNYSFDTDIEPTATITIN